MVEFRKIEKRYPNGTLALRNVNLSIEKGEFVFLVGPSGSGKSTLIKLLMKEETPTEGQVVLDGKTVSELPRRAVPYLRRNLGIVFQDFRLLHNKTVYENVAFAMQIIGAYPKEIRRRVPMCLGLVGLSNKSKAYPGELSGGEQQRVALARAIVNNPTLILADEPTGNLDPDTSRDIMMLLHEINQRGTTVIVATHDKNIVNWLQKRVIAIESGTVVRDQERGLYEDEY